MNSKLMLFMLLLSPLVARENPFFASDPLQSEKISSNIVESKPPLGSLNYTFPDQVRILKEVSFTVQNLDGSIETQKLQIDKTIDWHKPVVISQGKSTISSATGYSAAAHADFGIIKLYTERKTLSISSSIPLLRHFTLSNPNRIVVDFKDDREFAMVEKTLNAAPFLSSSVDAHGKFIRLTITLDGRYAYAFKHDGNTIKIVCK